MNFTEEVRLHDMSLMAIRNNVVERVDPCGFPFVSWNLSDR